MIRGLILYYLSIKPTHGYEIQRFIVFAGLDQWTKIQSGSIYYALTKLEKEKFIKVQREERTGSRVRKIYEITDKGRVELKEEMKKELAMPILDVDSSKFIIYPMLGVLSKDNMEAIIKKHIEELKHKKDYWEKWRDTKAGEDSSKITQLSFSMTIHSIEDQIIWHEELLANLESYMEEAKKSKKMIQIFEADSCDIKLEEEKTSYQLKEMEKIKKQVESDPKKAIEQLNKLIEELKNK